MKNDALNPAVLKRRLDALYARYNRRELIQTDPLAFVYRYEDAADREIVALIASALAYGRVAHIMKSVEAVLGAMGRRPARFLKQTSNAEIGETYRNFRHRFTGGAELTALLTGMKGAIAEHGSLRQCFLAGLDEKDETVLPALEKFAERIASLGHGQPTFLLTSPADGSACKRMNLCLRWLVRHDAVDPGGWEEAGAHRLVIPLDTHLFRICRALGLTRRNQANLRAAMEITESFRAIAPKDPIRYDFALCRLGILKEAGLNEFLASCGVAETPCSSK